MYDTVSGRRDSGALRVLRVNMWGMTSHGFQAGFHDFFSSLRGCVLVSDVHIYFNYDLIVLIALKLHDFVSTLRCHSVS